MEHQEPFFPLKVILLAIVRYNLSSAQGSKVLIQMIYQLHWSGTLRC